MPSMPVSMMPTSTPVIALVHGVGAVRCGADHPHVPLQVGQRLAAAGGRCRGAGLRGRAVRSSVTFSMSSPAVLAAVPGASPIGRFRATPSTDRVGAPRRRRSPLLALSTVSRPTSALTCVTCPPAATTAVCAAATEAPSLASTTYSLRRLLIAPFVGTWSRPASGRRGRPGQWRARPRRWWPARCVRVEWTSACSVGRDAESGARSARSAEPGPHRPDGKDRSGRNRFRYGTDRARRWSPGGTAADRVPEDLFSAAVEDRLRRQSPLAARLRPRTLDEIVGQEHLVGSGPAAAGAGRGRPPLLGHLLGAAGNREDHAGPGRGGHARAGPSSSSPPCRPRSRTCGRSSSGPAPGSGERDQRTILFLDEIHRFNKAQQDALLPSVEDGLLTLIGATTENPFFEVNPPLRSRSTLFRLEPLGPDALRTLAERGLEAEGATAAEPGALDALVDRSGGDGRQVLTSLEVAVALADRAAGIRRPSSTPDDVTDALGVSALRYGRDDHYDVISAFIKSIRGSDPDAGLYWLARMLEAGEDARFIARRLVILASEDVGMADPHGAAGGGRRRRRGGARRAAGGPAQPGPGRRAPGHGAEEQPRRARHLERPRGRARGPAGRGAGPPARQPLHGRGVASATVPATCTRTTTRGAGCRSATCPSSWRPSLLRAGPTTASRPRWPAARRRGATRRARPAGRADRTRPRSAGAAG